MTHEMHLEMGILEVPALICITCTELRGNDVQEHGCTNPVHCQPQRPWSERDHGLTIPGVFRAHERVIS